MIAHEIGHHLDAGWANTPNSPSGDFASTAPKFEDLFNHDRFNLNNKWLAGNKYSKRKPCGGGGALVNLFDGTRGKTVLPNGTVQIGQYVCDGNSLRTRNLGDYDVRTPNVPTMDPGYVTAYSDPDKLKGRNYAVLRWVDARFGKKQETFANTFAAVSGNRANFHFGYTFQTRMIDAQFPCIKAFVSSLRLHEGEPANGYSYSCERDINPIGVEEVPDDE